MTRSLRWIAALVIAFPLSALSAETPTLQDITAGDYNKIVKELSANFAYSSVTPASSLGSVWGFEFGIVGGITKTPEILALVKRADPNTKFTDDFPHVAPMVRLTVPLGITLEAQILPKTTFSKVSLKQTAGAAQWTITDVFFEDLPVHWAVKGYVSETSVDYRQNVTPLGGGPQVPATIDFDDTLWGVQTMISKKLFVFEPYVGIGWVHARGDLTVRADVPATIFNPAFTQGSSASTTPTSAQFLGGLDLRLAFFSLGAEYQRVFNTSSYTGRVSFRF